MDQEIGEVGSLLHLGMRFRHLCACESTILLVGVKAMYTPRIRVSLLTNCPLSKMHNHGKENFKRAL